MHEEICDRGARESVCVRAKIAVGEGEEVCTEPHLELGLEES